MIPVTSSASPQEPHTLASATERSGASLKGLSSNVWGKSDCLIRTMANTLNMAGGHGSLNENYYSGSLGPFPLGA